MNLFDELSGNIKEGGRLLAERKLSCVRNYIIFQLANKVFGLASVIFSLMGLISISVRITVILFLFHPLCLWFLRYMYLRQAE